jgi:HlyD family secretion protein
MLAKFSKQWALWAKRVVWLMLGLLLVGGLMRWAFRPNPVEVEVSEAVLQPFSAWIEEEARTRVRERFVVSAPALGRLRRMPWKEGQMVRKGEILAILDAPSPALLDARKNQEHTAQLAVAQARKDMAESQLAVAIMQRLQAQDSFNRQADLHAQGFVSDAKIQADHYALQSSMANFDAAIHSQRQAMAEVALVQAGALMNGPLAKPLFIYSPMDGQILRVAQASETSVQAGTVLLEMADLDDMQVVVPFLSADMAQVQVAKR